MTLPDFFLQNGAVAGLLAVLVLAACRIVKPSPAVRHALWLVVLIKLLTPPVVCWPWALPSSARLVSLGDAPRRIDDATGEVESIREPAIATSVVEIESPIEACDPRVEPRASDASLDSTGATYSAMALPALFIAWLAGALVLFAVELIRVIRFQRLVARSTPAPAQLEVVVKTLSTALGVRPPALRIVRGASSPLLWSLGRPRMLLPDCLVGRVDLEAWRGIIAHELAHLKRRDHWIAWLELAGELAWWWNPVYWLARRELRDASELCCDAWVVWALPEIRRVYAEALIEVCQIVSEGRAPAPALGLRSGARGAFFKRRLRMILLESAPRRIPSIGFIAAGLLACAVLPGWSQEDGDEIAPPPAPAAKPAPPAESVPVALPAPPVAPVAPATPPVPAVPRTPRVPRAAQLPPAPGGAGGRAGAVVLEPPPGLSGGVVLAPSPIPGGGGMVLLGGDDRLAELERKLRKLSAEVEQLRAEKAGMALEPPMQPASGLGVSRTPPMRRMGGVAGTMPGGPGLAPQGGSLAGALDGLEGTSATLIRTKYKLPKAKAEALAAFLREHVDADLDVAVRGDALIITSDEATSAAVRQMVSIMSRGGNATGGGIPGLPVGGGAAPGGASGGGGRAR